MSNHLGSWRQGQSCPADPPARVKGYPSLQHDRKPCPDHTGRRARAGHETIQTPRKWRQDKILQWCQSWYLACSYQWPDFQPASWKHELNENAISAQQRSVQGWLWTYSSVKGTIPSLLKSSKLTPPYKPANDQYIYSVLNDLWSLPVQITNAPPIYNLLPTYTMKTSNFYCRRYS